MEGRILVEGVSGRGERVLRKIETSTQNLSSTPTHPLPPTPTVCHFVAHEKCTSLVRGCALVRSKSTLRLTYSAKKQGRKLEEAPGGREGEEKERKEKGREEREGEGEEGMKEEGEIGEGMSEDMKEIQKQAEKEIEEREFKSSGKEEGEIGIEGEEEEESLFRRVWDILDIDEGLSHASGSLFVCFCVKILTSLSLSHSLTHSPPERKTLDLDNRFGDIAPPPSSSFSSPSLPPGASSNFLPCFFAE